MRERESERDVKLKLTKCRRVVSHGDRVKWTRFGEGKKSVYRRNGVLYMSQHCQGNRLCQYNITVDENARGATERDARRRRRGGGAGAGAVATAMTVWSSYTLCYTRRYIIMI